MKRLLAAVLLFAVPLAYSVETQPANFLIKDFTFERPPAWRWIQPGAETEKARLFISDKASNERAIISFELLPRFSVQSVIDKWKEPYLAHNPPPEVELTTNSISHYKLVTAHITGTKTINRQISTNQVTHGVVITLDNEQLVARILASKPMEATLEPTFNMMVRHGVNPDE